jgi:hypothetical protein
VVDFGQKPRIDYADLVSSIFIETAAWLYARRSLHSDAEEAVHAIIEEAQSFRSLQPSNSWVYDLERFFEARMRVGVNHDDVKWHDAMAVGEPHLSKAAMNRVNPRAAASGISKIRDWKSSANAPD